MGRNLLRAEVFRRWTVDQWYEPFAAIREFADQDLLGRSDNADEEHRRLGDELPSGAGMTAEEYKNARDQADRASVRVRALRALLQEDLERQLVSGDLIARGFREPFTHGAPYLTISRNEWRIIKLEPPSHATGGGVSYVGLTIGRPGARRFLGSGL
jgi:hypothetical protein